MNLEFIVLLALGWAAGNHRRPAHRGAPYLFGDHLGSTSVVAAPNGARRARTLYKPFGEVRYQSGTLPTEYRAASPQRSEGDTFTGQYAHVDDFGLLYYVARWYDPALGRFVQADTVVPGAGSPSAWDRYAYTQNNPLRYTDPSGHKVDPFGDDFGSVGPRVDETPTIIPSIPSTPTPCPQAANACLPTVTPTPPPQPTPTPYNGPVITAPHPPLPHLEINISIDWSKVDMVDFWIDIFGLATNAVEVSAAALGAAPIAIEASLVGDVVEGAGLIKSGYELLQGDPSDMLLWQTTTQTERVVVLLARTERLTPLIGFIGNGVSLWINLKPEFTIQWETQ